MRDAIAELFVVLDRAPDVLARPLEQAAELVARCLRSDGLVLTLGNGGSATDAQHLASELVGHFDVPRRPLRAVALTADGSVLTSLGNDLGFEHVFARQVDALARPGDVVIAISTSGRSVNAVRAAEAARDRGASVIALTGEGGGELAARADLTMRVPSRSTARVQEVHALCIHVLVGRVQALLTDGERNR